MRGEKIEKKKHKDKNEKIGELQNGNREWREMKGGGKEEDGV